MSDQIEHKSTWRDKLKSRLKTPRIWLIFLSLGLVTSIIINVVALMGIRQLADPPDEGEFADELQTVVIENPTNITGTLFEDTVDKLSAGVVPVLIFPRVSDFCGEPEGFDLVTGACVDRFDATYIAVSEELINNYQTNWEAATEAGLTEEAELINQWERHIAAHEFGHILQYNYLKKSLPYYEKFGDGYLGRAREDMAECYGQLQYPLTAEPAKKEGEYVDIEFYGFPAKERFALCTEEQLQDIRDWLKAIDYPEGNRLPEAEEVE